MTIPGTTGAILSVEGVTKRFGGFVAIDRISFSLRQGELVSIIGPNGAGKTTLFNMLTGQVTPTAGNVLWQGRSINRLPPHRRARLGMGRTFQVARPFLALNALENVMVGAFLRHRALGAARDHAIAALDEVGLADRAYRQTSELTLSERRRLEVARALALEPQVILLDEVMAGLNAAEIEQAITMLRGLHARGLTLLVIEHNLKVVSALSQRVIVLDHGVLIGEGSAADILRAPDVITAYLGRRHAWNPS